MVSALIVAAGRGTRMGPGVDKIFLEVAGRPIVAHTWQRFENAPAIEEIVLVIRPGLEGSFDEIAHQSGFRKPYRFAPGGAERQDSVWNGLQALSPHTDIVAIQDAARPCTSLQVIADTIAAARRTGAAVAAQRVVDTIKESDGGRLIGRHLDRQKLWAVQTPQTFRLEIIRRALSEVRRTGAHVTDDTAACALIDQPVELVEDGFPNPKATAPADLPVLEHLLSASPPLAKERPAD